MGADATIDAAAGTDIEIDAALRSLRSGRLIRIQQANREIPKLYGDIKATEERIEMYRVDREWCEESLKVLDRRITEREDI